MPKFLKKPKVIELLEKGCFIYKHSNNVYYIKNKGSEPLGCVHDILRRELLTNDLIIEKSGIYFIKT